jgi:hypothetical protein
MNNLAQFIAVGASVVLLLLVLELVRRRRLSEEYSLIWILFSGALIVLSLARGMLDALALRLGILYGPALLLLILIFFVAVVSLHFSLVISKQRRQIDRLIEDVALLEARNRGINKIPDASNRQQASGNGQTTGDGQRATGNGNSL